VRRILNEEPTPQFKNKAFQKYDCVLTEGMLTETQRKMEFGQLLELVKIGLPVPPEYLLEPLIVQNKDKLIAAIQQQQQAAQEAQQKQEQQQMQQMQSERELVQARVLSESGLGVERMSRIQENKQLATERQAKAEKDRQSATLDTIKGLKELDDMELNRLYRSYQILKEIEREQNVNNLVQSEVEDGRL